MTAMATFRIGVRGSWPAAVLVAMVPAALVALLASAQQTHGQSIAGRVARVKDGTVRM